MGDGASVPGRADVQDHGGRRVGTGGDPGRGQRLRGADHQAAAGLVQVRVTVTQEPSTSPYDIQFNTKIPPFNNINARLAIYYATNTQLLDEKLFGNTYPVTQSFTAPAGLFYEPSVPGYPSYDLAKAKSLVKQLGGLNINYFTIQQPQTQPMMVAMQQMWKEAGINASIHSIRWRA